jgi:hypothetical protein
MGLRERTCSLQQSSEHYHVRKARVATFIGQTSKRHGDDFSPPAFRIAAATHLLNPYDGATLTDPSAVIASLPASLNPPAEGALNPLGSLLRRHELFVILGKALTGSSNTGKATGLRQKANPRRYTGTSAVCALLLSGQEHTDASTSTGPIRLGTGRSYGGDGVFPLLSGPIGLWRSCHGDSSGRPFRSRKPGYKGEFVHSRRQAEWDVDN